MEMDLVCDNCGELHYVLIRTFSNGRYCLGCRDKLSREDRCNHGLMVMKVIRTKDEYNASKGE